MNMAMFGTKTKSQICSSRCRFTKHGLHVNHIYQILVAKMCQCKHMRFQMDIGQHVFHIISCTSTAIGHNLHADCAPYQIAVR